MSHTHERLPLAEAIQDSELKQVVLDLWEQSRPIHEKQQAPGSLSDNGRKHCVRVEHNMHKIVKACGTTLSDCERFLLSAAACCHDYGRSLSEEEVRAFDGDHGKASADMVRGMDAGLEFDSRLRSLVALLVALHTPSGSVFLARSGELTSVDLRDDWGRPNLLLLALLLRLGDMLDTTIDRLLPLPDESSFPDEGGYLSAVFRSRTWGFHAERSSLRVTLRYRTKDERDEIDRAWDHMCEHEFRPVRGLLESSHLPFDLYRDVDRHSYLPDLAVTLSPTEQPSQPQVFAEPDRTEAAAEPSPHGATPECPCLWLAKEALALAQCDPTDRGTRERARSILAAPVPGPYWLVSSLNSASWIPTLETQLRVIARSSDEVTLRGLGTALVRIAEDAPEAILSSGLLQALWEGPTSTHHTACLRALRATGGWEMPFGKQVMEDVLNERRDQTDGLSFALHEYAMKHPGRVGVVLDWHIALLATGIKGEQRAGRRIPFEWVLGQLIEKSGLHGLRRSYEIIEADLGRERDERAALFAIERDSSLYEENRAFVKTRDLLVGELNAPTQEGNDRVARSVVRRLLAAPNVALRALGMSICLDALGACLYLAADTLADNTDFADDTYNFSRYLLHQVFEKLPAEKRRPIEDALLTDLPESNADEPTRYRRLRALQAIPEELQSKRIQAAINSLSVSLAIPARSDEAPDDPRDGLRTWVEVDHPPQVPLDDVADNMPALIERVKSILSSPSSDEFRRPAYALEAGLRELLKNRPCRRTPIAEAFAALDPPLYEQAIPGVVAMLDDDESFTGEHALKLADVLPEDPGSRVRDRLATVIGKKWANMEQDSRAKALELLVRWSRQEPSPSPDDAFAESDADPTGLLAQGINTPRGAIAMWLLVVTQHVEEAPEALAAIRELAQDPSPLVRAAVLYHVRGLRDKHRESALEIVQTALAAGPPPQLFAIAAHALRYLEGDEVERVGLPLVEGYVDADDQHTQESLGLLVGVWSLKADYPRGRSLVMRFAREATDDARRRAAHAVAYNTAGREVEVTERARGLTRALLVEDDAVLRAGLLSGFPLDQKVDCAPVVGLIRETLRRGEAEVMDEAVRWVALRSVRQKGDAVAPLIEGILASPGAARYLFQRLGHYGSGVTEVYEALRERGREGLALELLDAAAYHCIEEARLLIESVELPVQGSSE